MEGQQEVISHIQCGPSFSEPVHRKESTGLVGRCEYLLSRHSHQCFLWVASLTEETFLANRCVPGSDWEKLLIFKEGC